MMCHYPESHVNNTKHLCKGENPFNCSELIHTEEGEIDATEGRLYIRDSKRSKYFYVNINNLRTSDSGTYWCSFGRGRCNDGYTRTDLFVGEHTENMSIIHCNTRTAWLFPSYAPGDMKWFDQNMNCMCWSYAGVFQSSPIESKHTRFM